MTTDFKDTSGKEVRRPFHLPEELDAFKAAIMAYGKAPSVKKELSVKQERRELKNKLADTHKWLLEKVGLMGPDDIIYLDSPPTQCDQGHQDSLKILARTWANHLSGYRGALSTEQTLLQDKFLEGYLRIRNMMTELLDLKMVFEMLIFSLHTKREAIEESEEWLRLNVPGLITVPTRQDAKENEDEIYI